MHEKNQLPLLGLLLSLGLVISTFLIGGVVRDVRMSHQIIKVRGYAEKLVQSDVAVWQLSLATRTKDLQEGYTLIEAQTQEVMAFLKTNSVETGIRIFPVSLTEERKRDSQGHETNVIEFRKVQQQLEITSGDVHKLAALSTSINQLIKGGIEIQSTSPSYYYSKLNDVKGELLTAATRDARMRAQTLADGSGVKLGYLRAARQGSFSVRSGAVSTVSSDDETSYDDVSAITKRISAVVTVDYSMK